MVNEEIVEIFNRYNDRMEEYHPTMDITDGDIRDFLAFFETAGASEDETLLYYNTYTDEDSSDLAVAITDHALYYSFRFNVLDIDTIVRRLWRLRGIESVGVRRYGDIIFHLSIDPAIQGPIKIAASDFFDENMLENTDDLQLFVDMIGEMSHADREAEQREEEEERLKKKKEEEKLRKEKEKKEKLRKQKEEEERLRRQKEEEERQRKQEEEKRLRMKKAEEEKWHKYDVKVTEKNLGEILGAGKTGKAAGVDLSALSKLQSKEEELNRVKRQALSSSPLGTTRDISSKRVKITKGVREVELLQKKLAAVKKSWEAEAYPLFLAATHANTRIVLGSNGYSIAQGRNKESLYPGVYTVSVPVAGKVAADHLPEGVEADIKAKAESLAGKWKECLTLNGEVWKKVGEITGRKTFEAKSTPEDVLTTAKSDLDSAYAQAEKYEGWQSEIKSLESEIAKLRLLKKAVMNKLNSIDPILTSFSLPEGKDIYTPEWLEDVKRAAESRKSMPYLPLYWSDKAFGTVFDWQQAIEDGKPNLFIEAATDEGLEGRMDMLDNFIASMLLAFPIKDVHFTVLEQSTINSFVNDLPDKVCQVYDAGADTEAIRSFTRKLKEMYRAGRDNIAPNCSPHEIVVIAGFNKKDRVFSTLMENLSEIIENGKRAGIYFAIVLAKDITEYDWKDADANNFEEFFTPYSTILTDKKDKEGNPIPAYNLLKKDADVPSETGDKAGCLAELVTTYVKTESSTIQNKVYDLIENGKMYTNDLISDLDKQQRKDIGKLVIPIATDDEGKEIDMLLDDKEYMFYFILGMTGSGKSFTLHTILTNLMLKYDPSVLDVVIMDFKGGVEMADYRGVPHVSSILANGADAQVAGEMLMSLSKEMTRRDDLFTKSGTKSISEYNRYAIKNGLEQMKNIIFLVDECQDLFKIDRPINSSEFIAMLAKKGRIYGIHMILATQTLNNAGIPRDALSQFSDFIFMKCTPDDVAKCGISNTDLQKQVAMLNKGEMYYCHGQAEPVHGFVYNYAGKGNVYKDKTLENLKGKRFPRPAKEQFYFDSQQVFLFDNDEIKALVKKSKSGLKTTPSAVLGKNLSVNLDTLYTKLGKGDGTNLLVLGANDRLQGERVLWNAVKSLYECNQAIGQKARYYILPNIPEDVDDNAIEAHEKRLTVVKNLASQPDVTLVEEDERADTIERVAATVRGRINLAETDKKAVDTLDAIYLVIPNQQMFAKNMGRRPKGLESLDSGVISQVPEQQSALSGTSSSASETDSLGFEGLNMPGSDTSSPGFDAIDFGSFDSPAASAPSTPAIQAGKPGRDYDEELRYILEYGPSVNVHVLLQTTVPDKIYSGDAMREKEMTLLFNDIILLKMMQASTMSLPVDSRVIERLSAEPQSLRAIAYNGERDPRTIVPFDFK